MKKMLQLLCMLQITIMLYGSFVTANCGGCMSNGVACLNEVEFTTCYNDETTQNLVSCGDGERCTSGPNICEPIDSDFPEICPFTGPCNICTHSDGRFACLNETHFGFCYGRYTPYLNSVGACPPNYVCSTLAIHEICVPASLHKPTCISTHESSTTSSPIEITTHISSDETSIDNEELFKYVCKLLGKGPHAYPGNCKRYYSCINILGNIFVDEQDCPPETPYFDNSKKSCQILPVEACF